MNEDIILHIYSFLDDKCKIIYLSVLRKDNKSFDTTIKRILFVNSTKFNQIINMHPKYFDQFTNVQYCQLYANSIGLLQLPKNIKKLTIGGSNRIKIKNRILKKLYYSSNSITHLTFGTYFNQEIKECIPNSVTHLTFGSEFNQKIKNCIPNSVTHLTFGFDFNQEIKTCIPNSVTHLTFGFKFNQEIKEYIPNSVTHLTFGHDFRQEIKECIPNSVIFLTFADCFNLLKRVQIPKSVLNVKYV